MARIFIGVGHGGKDPGAVHGGLKEKDVNLAIALACRDTLLRHGVTVGISRTGDENDPLSDEIAECNAFAPDYAVEIHNNSGGGDGAEIYHHYGGGRGKTLAENILKQIVLAGQNSRGLKIKKNSSGRDYFGWIRQTVCPAVLVECAFLDNKEDVTAVNNKQKQTLMGQAVAKGILVTLGIAYKPTEPPTAPKGEAPLYRVQVGAYKDRKNAEAMLTRLKGAGFDGFITEG